MSTLTDMTGFVMRNPAWMTKDVRESYAVAKVMNEYRKNNPYCEWTGRNKIQVHHVMPVSVRPDLADRMCNLISLHPKIHLYVGHAGNFKWYVPMIKTLARSEITRTVEYSDAE